LWNESDTYLAQKWRAEISRSSLAKMQPLPVSSKSNEDRRSGRSNIEATASLNQFHHLDNQMLHSVHGHFEILVLAVWAQDSVDQFLDSFHSLTYRRDTTHICDTLYECCYTPLDVLWCVSVRKALGQHCRVSTAYLSFAASSQARGNRLS
jgi:hypothetical protein